MRFTCTLCPLYERVVPQRYHSERLLSDIRGVGLFQARWMNWERTTAPTIYGAGAGAEEARVRRINPPPWS